MEPIVVTSDTDNAAAERASLVPKTSDLPPHIQALLYGSKRDRQLPDKCLVAYSLLQSDYILNNLNRPLRILPWEKDGKQQHRGSVVQSTTKNVFLPRIKKQTDEAPVGTKETSYHKFNEVINKSSYGKIQFYELGLKGDALPPWVISRLETACRSFRYELPFNKKLLEEMTPLQFLSTQTRLSRDQRRRYSELFKKYKNKLTDLVEFKNLFPALNVLFGSYLSVQNFDTLVICLFINEETKVDENVFIGLCAFADRLFWTAYLDCEEDTFTVWEKNRTALEFADFENLRRKLVGLHLTKEMKALLYSLA
ncbi:uncharacterized protein LOC131927537 [Physella acuta]|uniref:uncharacterized protein LOC131927537 n=1 Tax=Physella acuta TaxID=109671 RepID=UPI0027DC14B7|nr:uncharacterized protein LOC131927537 [Physella acuta]